MTGTVSAVEAPKVARLGTSAVPRVWTRPWCPPLRLGRCAVARCTAFSWPRYPPLPMEGEIVEVHQPIAARARSLRRALPGPPAPHVVFGDLRVVGQAPTPLTGP